MTFFFRASFYSALVIRSRINIIFYAWLMTLVGVASAQTQTAALNKVEAWPNKTLKLVVGFPPGSTPDMAARTLAEPLSKALGQPVIVENKPGAAGNIALNSVAKSTDNHTLGVAINGNLTVAKILYPKMGFDPNKELALISLIATAPLVMVTAKDIPAGNDFVAAAKASGNKWNFGSVGVGSQGHLGVELMKSLMPGFKAVHVPFSGNPQVLNALLGGQIQLALMPPGVALPMIKAGRINAVGLVGGRSALAPELGSISERGISGVSLDTLTALVAPSTLPKANIERLSRELAQILRQPDTRQKLFSQGWIASPTSPEATVQRIRFEALTMSGLVAALGIKNE